MAFWGIEVKPSTPFVHSCEKATGRLRISQATLGIGGPTKRNVVVQCKVGNRIPVLLCSLIPSQTESCHLELEFEEADDVVFSVIGPKSVYLTGYYVCKIQQYNPQSDTESYGVDIENSHTEGSSLGSDEDKYEESFINDDELEDHSSSNDDDENTPENSNLKNKNGRGKRLKKKSQIVESDDDSRESEDWNMTMFKSKKAAMKNYMKLENDDIVGKNGEPERAKTRKKRKELSDEEKSGEDKGLETDASKNVEIEDDGKRSKKRRKEDKPESPDNASQPEKKIKKKKNKKTQREGDSGSSLPNTKDNQENTFLKSENPKKTLSNGLVIEEVVNGPLDGKVAAMGKKVKIYYTAMLKENGYVFDSNVGKSAYKFRLGDGGSIDVWTLGIDGMHVGDKRRLIVPPSMGFGKHWSGENVPLNSWLVYDVELVGVRK
ncbi:hypothetical protein CASFOL_029290 [Castilleja foliolosa]|uniref:peptidylprolyl isomerase n=1 Tax=Castilleja foliolosa TaxID=1961234 RepID=A0ABD3CAL6_9LAMI